MPLHVISRFPVWPGGLALLFIWLSGFLSTPVAQTGLVAPYLQNATPNSIVIKWETNTNAESIVEYGLTETLGSSQSGTAMTTPGSTQLHTVSLASLSPGTRYFYKARTGTWTSGVYDFETPPLRDSEAPLNIVLMSDMQKDGGHPNIFHDLVNNSLLPYVEAHYGTPLSDKVQMAVLPGDLVDIGSNYNQWKNDYFNPAEALWRSVPAYPAIGNHEGNSQNYFNYFTLPENGTPGFLEHWYFTDYSNVRVISCNTNSGYRIQAQLDWLDSILTVSCADTLIDFVFAQMHHPYLSELWIAGNTDYTGQIIDRLETFSADCGKPSVHFFGHTHAYSRGQSRDHEHLWINVATSGGNIDYWGEFANQDYAEYIISTDDYGFVMVEVQAGSSPQFAMKRLSFGDQNNPGGSTVTDSLVIRIDNAVPATPYPLFPTPADTVNPLCTTMKADGFSDPDGDGFGAAHWQVASDSAGFGTPLRESWKQYANWYNEVNTQAGDDLTDETFADLPAGEELWWRVRYRDKALGWSAWSTPTQFHTLPMDTLTGNLVLNAGAENGTSQWTTETGYFTTLVAQECTSGTNPHMGNRFFAPGTNASCADVTYGAAYQDINLSAFSSAIDAGNVSALFGAYLTAWATNNDAPSIAVAFLDDNGNVIESSDTLEHRLLGWTWKSQVTPIPPSSRTARFRLMGTRLAGTDNDSYIDDVFLQLISAPSGCSTYVPPGPAMGRVYVDQNAPAYPDGKSWTTAYRTLRDALAQSNTDTTVQEIWIAEGLYPVTTGSDRFLSFLVMRGVSIYGGFAGDESALAERNVVAHPVILSGDIGETGIAGDNSYHVINVAGITDTLRLDGLTISGGYADGDGHDRGGGIRTRVSNLAPVILKSCLLSGNAGVAAGTIFNESELLLIESTLDQAESSGMGHVIVLNTGPLARLILADTTIIQHGTAPLEGLRSLDGAELHVTADSAIEHAED